MKIKNDNSTYGVLARLFHWLTFLILLIQLPLGLYLDNLEFSEFKLTVENTHHNWYEYFLFNIIKNDLEIFESKANNFSCE